MEDLILTFLSKPNFLIRDYHTVQIKPLINSMKNGMFLFTLLFAMSLFGQDNPFPAQTAIQNVFAHINTTQIPTGYLQEYAVPLIPMNIFNGVLSDSNKVDMNVWRMTYATLLTARINGSNPIPDLATVNTMITGAQTTNGGANVIATL